MIAEMEEHNHNFDLDEDASYEEVLEEYQYFKDYKNYMSNNQTRPWVYSQLVSGAGDMIGPVIQGYFAGTTDMDTTLDQLDSKFSELLE